MVVEDKGKEEEVVVVMVDRFPRPFRRASDAKADMGIGSETDGWRRLGFYRLVRGEGCNYTDACRNRGEKIKGVGGK